MADLNSAVEADRAYMRNQLSGVSGPTPGIVYVHGDSTAVGDGSVNNDAKWGVLHGIDGGVAVVNSGLSGQGVAAGVDRLIAQTENRDRCVVFKDVRNTGETAAAWLAQAALVVAACPYVLIEPQLGVTDGSADAPTLQIYADINAGILAQFPNNTYDATTQAAYIAALSNAETRSDGLHRNDMGQAVEALFISAFFRSKGWRRQRPETADALARMAVQPSAWVAALLNAFIERQIGSGRWGKSDVLYNALLHDAQAATLNLISAGYPATKVGTVAFAAYQGLTGDGSTGYHKTGFDPALVPGAKFQQNSAHLLVHNLTNVPENKADIGSTTNTPGASSFSSRNADDSRSSYLNQTGSTTFGAGATTSIGRSGVIRPDADRTSFAVGTGIIATAASTSIAPAGGELLWGSGYSGLSTKRRAFASIGAALTNPELRHSYYGEVAFAKAVGAL